MGVVGGPRHFTERTPAAFPWTCPACRAKNTSPFEEGCPACGANTVAANAAAQLAAQTPVDLRALVLGGAADGMRDSLVTAFIALKGYSAPARYAVGAALAFAAENGMALGEDGLTTRQMLAWAHEIMKEDE